MRMKVNPSQWMPTGGLTSQFQSILSKDKKQTQLEKNNFHTFPALTKSVGEFKEKS